MYAWADASNGLNANASSARLHAREFVGPPVLLREICIRGLVVAEGLSRWVENDGAPQMVRNISEMADRRTQPPHFDIRVRPVPAPYRVQEIFLVRATCIFDGFADLAILVVGGPARSADHQRAIVTVKGRAELRAFERPVLAESAQFPEDEEVAVIVRYPLGAGNLLRVVEPVNAAVARYSFRQTTVHAPHRLDAPHREVEHVYALVTDLAIAVVPEEAPVVMEPVGIERSLGGRAKPYIIVDGGRRRPVRRSPDAFAHLRVPRLHQTDFSQLAGCQVFDGALAVFAAAPLGPDLHDPVILARRIANQMALVDGLRYRLLQ